MKIELMNLYFVISELLTEVVWEDWTVRAGHEESYRIAELVIARNRSQARYLVALSDDAWCRNSGSLRDVPRMSVRKLGEGFDPPALIVTNNEHFQHWWDKTDGMLAPDYVPPAPVVRDAGTAIDGEIPF